MTTFAWVLVFECVWEAGLVRNTVDLHSLRLQTRWLTFEWTGGGSLWWGFCCHAGWAKENGQAHCWDLCRDSLSCLLGLQVTIGALHKLSVGVILGRQRTSVREKDREWRWRGIRLLVVCVSVGMPCYTLWARSHLDCCERGQNSDE